MPFYSFWLILSGWVPLAIHTLCSRVFAFYSYACLRNSRNANGIWWNLSVMSLSQSNSFMASVPLCIWLYTLSLFTLKIQGNADLNCKSRTMDYFIFKKPEPFDNFILVYAWPWCYASEGIPDYIPNFCLFAQASHIVANISLRKAANKKKKMTSLFHGNWTWGLGIAKSNVQFSFACKSAGNFFSKSSNPSAPPPPPHFLQKSNGSPLIDPNVYSTPVSSSSRVSPTLLY